MLSCDLTRSKYSSKCQYCHVNVDFGNDGVGLDVLPMSTGSWADARIKFGPDPSVHVGAVKDQANINIGGSTAPA